jgi:PAS domain S-box-containing protein
MNRSRHLNQEVRTNQVIHVDDEPGFADLAAKFLEREDDRLTVETATSASEALDRLDEHDYDCIVSDYDMPGQDGIEFLETVREDYPDLPFILFTGKGSEEVASEAISAGLTDYLQKGADSSRYEVLANRIQNAISHQESERELKIFKEAIEHAGHSIYIADTDGTIEYVNPAFEEVTGYSADEALGRTPRILKSGEHDESYYDNLWGTILSGDNWKDEVINERKDGERYIINQTIAPVMNDSGEIKNYVAVNVPITERKERERALERYETLIEVTGDPMYRLDEEGHFTYVNEALVEISGYGEATLLGEHVSKVMDEDDIERGDQVIGSLLSSGERGGTFEMDVITADGERIPTENHISVLFADGEFQGSLGVLRDITDRLERERQLQRERDRLDQFASLVTHDLRNPLNVAASRLELAMEGCESEHLDSVAWALERIETLIDDVLSLARAGETVGEMESVELPELVEACWQTVETASTRLAVETDTTIQADQTRLKQLFENLFRNAVEHGGEDVTITVGDLPDGFYVADDGPGIPEADRGKIFDAGYSTAEEGTGFGLSIVWEIAEAHGWEIHVTDSSDGGVQFEVSGVTLDS